MAASLLALPTVARAEVPTAPDAHGREFRVDFSARHLEVDAELGELSLSGDVVVTVGRYRLGGERVRLQRGPRGISVQGGGDIAFCACESPPVTLGYSSVTIAPPSDVVIKNAVLRAGGVPLFWLPYLWLRSPDRTALIFPSLEWRGNDGLLVGSGLHLPFEANQGRPAARALDIGAFGYLNGGARVDLHLLTPQSTSFVRWDYLQGSALSADAHAASSGESDALWAYDADFSRGSRGRSSLSALEAAARRHDHARLGVASTGQSLFGFGVAAEGERGDWLSEPLDLGPFAVAAKGGELGKSSSYALDLAAASWQRPGQARAANAEARALERGSLESSTLLGPALMRFAAFEQGELVSLPAQSVSRLRGGAAVALGVPLVRRFGALVHSVSPQLLGRLERQYWDGAGENQLVATGGLQTALGSRAPGAAGRLWLGGGLAGEPEQPEPVAESSVAVDTRWVGLRASALAEPRAHAAEATARARLGPRGGTTLTGYVEARTEASLASAPALGSGDLLPTFQDSGGYDREGLTTGAELTLRLGSVVFLGGGADLDPLAEQLLAMHSFARYRHGCGCVAIGAFASSRVGRGGGIGVAPDRFDAGLSLDLMP